MATTLVDHTTNNQTPSTWWAFCTCCEMGLFDTWSNKFKRGWGLFFPQSIIMRRKNCARPLSNSDPSSLHCYRQWPKPKFICLFHVGHNIIKIGVCHAWCCGWAYLCWVSAKAVLLESFRGGGLFFQLHLVLSSLSVYHIYLSICLEWRERNNGMLPTHCRRSLWGGSTGGRGIHMDATIVVRRTGCMLECDGWWARMVHRLLKKKLILK